MWQWVHSKPGFAGGKEALVLRIFVISPLKGVANFSNFMIPDEYPIDLALPSIEYE
jgi:hypothetical protein